MSFSVGQIYSISEAAHEEKSKFELKAEFVNLTYWIEMPFRCQMCKAVLGKFLCQTFCVRLPYNIF